MLQCNQITSEGLKNLIYDQSVADQHLIDAVHHGLQPIGDQVSERHLRRIHTLYISIDKISNEALKYLQGIHTLYILGYRSDYKEFFKYLIGDQSAAEQHLQGIQNSKNSQLHTLNIIGCYFGKNVFEYLTGIHTLNLLGCHIFNGTFMNFKGVHTLSILKCHIYEDIFEHLKGIHTLNISGCQSKGNVAKYLKGIHTLNVTSAMVCNDTCKYLTDIHTLNMSRCMISNQIFKYLKGIHTLNMSKCHINRKAFDYVIEDKDTRQQLTGLHILNVLNCEDYWCENFLKHSIEDQEVANQGLKEISILNALRYDYFDDEAEVEKAFERKV